MSAGLAMALFVGITPAYAQFNFKPSGLSKSTGTFTANTGGANIISITAGNKDDGISSPTPIGFNLNYNGQTMTHFIFGTNGFVKLGTSGAMTNTSGFLRTHQTGYFTRNIANLIGNSRNIPDFTGLTSSNALDANIVSPFNVDLDTVASGFAGINHTYELTGVAPNRVLTIEWVGVFDKQDNAVSIAPIYANLAFQAKLYETTNVVQFVYGPRTAAPQAADVAAICVTIGVKGTPEDDGTGSVQTLPGNMVVVTKAGGGSGGLFATPNEIVSSNNVRGTSITGSIPASAQFPGPALVYSGKVASDGMLIRFKSAAGAVLGTLAVGPVPENGRILTFTPYTTAGLKHTPALTSVTSQTWTDISGTGTAITTADQDNSNSAEIALPAGFAFEYAGITPTAFIFNTNGFMKVGLAGLVAPQANLFNASGGTPQSQFNPDLPTTGGSIGVYQNNPINNFLLMPFMQDLGPSGSTAYHTQVTGTAPNRVVTVQWKNVRDINSPKGSSAGNAVLFNTFSFQVKLNESTNVIDYVYEKPVLTVPGSSDWKAVNIGLRGSGNGSQELNLVRTVGANFFATVGSSYSNLQNGPFFGNSLVGSESASNNRVPNTGTTIRYEFQFADDLAASLIYAPSKSASGLSDVTVRAVIRNSGTNAYAGARTITLTSSGANTIAPATLSIPAIAAGATGIVDFGTISLGAQGNTTLTTTVNGTDDNNTNHVSTTVVDVNDNVLAYATAAPLNGGAGFNGAGAAGAFVAKYSLNSPTSLTFANVAFATGGANYRVVVYGETAGLPGTLLYISGINAAVAGTGNSVQICPALALPAGNFYLGVQQFQTGNIGFGFQTENPIRSGAFYSAATLANVGTVAGFPSTGWTDFNTNATTFRLAIEAVLAQTGAAPLTVINHLPANAATFVPKNASISWSKNTLGVAPTEVELYFGSVSPAPLINASYCGSSFTPTLVAGGTYFWRIVPKNGANVGPSTEFTFTVAPNPPNDNCANATTIFPCVAPTFGYTNNATQSLPASPFCVSDEAADVWYRFTATSSTTTISAAPIDPTFDVVIELRTGSCNGTYVGCIDIRGPGVEEATGFATVPGQGYFIRIHGYTEGVGVSNTGRFNLSIVNPGQWTGATNQNWSTATNWCGNVAADIALGAIIPVTANQPIVSATTSVLNLNVDNGAIVVINPGVTLNVRRNATTGGLLTGTGGTVGGAGTLALTSAGTAPNDFGVNPTGGNLNVSNLSIVNNLGMTLIQNCTLNVTGLLTSGGTTSLTNNGFLTFRSTATGTARWNNWTGNTYSGSGVVTQERFMTGSPRWSFIGAPVRNATIASWSNAGLQLQPLNNGSLLWFQEVDSSRTVINGDTAERNGWRVAGSTSDVINPGTELRGYRLWLRNTFLNGVSRTLSASGAPYVGNITASVTRTTGQYANGGYNLIINPYCSDIDMASGGITFTGVDRAIFTYNGAAGNYGVFVNGGTNDNAVVNGAANANVIASSQSFFVRATTAVGTVLFTEAAKTATAGTFFRVGDPVNQMRITARDAANHKEETLVRFRDGATDAMDNNMDAGSWGAEYISVSTVIANNPERADVNTLAPLAGRKSVWLSVQAPVSGAFALNFSELESFDANVDMFLVDHLTGTTTNVRNQAAYNFQITSNPASQGVNRFEVIFSVSSVTSNKNLSNGSALSAWPNPATGSDKVMVAVSGKLKGAAILQVLDVAGRIVHTQVLNLTGDANQAYELSATLSTGSYTLRATTDAATMATRLVVNR